MATTMLAGLAGSPGALPGAGRSPRTALLRLLEDGFGLPGRSLRSSWAIRATRDTVLSVPVAYPDESDVELAAALAWGAGHLLRDLRAADGAFEDPDLLGDEGDRQANDLILAGLRAARPDDAVLSEESADDPRRLSAPRVWIIDPLDGTRQYKRPNNRDWSVHIALWERRPDGGGQITAAAVGLPDHATVMTTIVPPGDVFDASRPPHDPPIIVVSDSRPPDISAVAAVLGARTMSMGSAGAKILAVVQGDADAYIHWGGQYQWDSAAPVAVALAHGFHASRVDGSPLVYNRAETALPDLLVCRPDLAPQILSALTNKK